MSGPDDTPLPLIGSAPPLVPGEVQVWQCRIARHARSLPELKATLSPDELARAEAFRFQKDHDSFVVSHGLLRSLLGHHLDAPPGEIVFGSNPSGKPFLVRSRTAPDIRFNLAHSHEAVVFAFTLGREVGVDLEFIRAEAVIEDLRLFAPSELNLLRSLAGQEKVHCFFQLWTRKEALLKAMGTGFDAPMETLQNPGSHRWSVIDLDCLSGFASALAVEGDRFRVARKEWPCVPAAP